MIRTDIAAPRNTTTTTAISTEAKMTMKLCLQTHHESLAGD
jgi:hypothetical protein